MNLLRVLRHAEGQCAGSFRGDGDERGAGSGGPLIISAHLIRITGRDHGARPPECRLQPHAEKSAENSPTGAADDEEEQIKAHLFFMNPRGPSCARLARVRS